MKTPEEEKKPPCLASLHDVMPETWSEIIEVLAWLKAHGVPPVSLLIVPGRQWEPFHIEQINHWSAEGHPLIAHGWFHHVENIRGLRHRLHSAFISRNVAEHLALTSDEIKDLLLRAHDWFDQNGLPTPTIYIPPAWALGPITQQHLTEVPYRLIETTRGLLDPSSGVRTNLPLTGFEADTPFREITVKAWNNRAVRKARQRGIPLRLSLHPFDLKLRLKDQLEAIVAMDWDYIDYAALSQAHT